MTSNLSDIMLPRAAWGSTAGRSRLIAFVPIVVALIGIGAIFLGGVTVRTSVADTASVTEIDPVTTGSIQTPEQRRRALEMLDR